MPRYYNNSGDTSLGLSNAVGGFLDNYMSQKQRKEAERQQLIIEALRQNQFEESQAGNLFKEEQFDYRKEQDALNRLQPKYVSGQRGRIDEVYPAQFGPSQTGADGVIPRRIDTIREPTPEKPASVSAQLKELVDKAILERAQSDPAFLNDYVNKKAFGKGVGGERSEKPTGIGNFKDVVSSRQKQADEARNAALWQIFDSFPELFFDKDKERDSGYAENPREEFIDYTPEQLVEYVKQQEPETIEQGGKELFSPSTWFNEAQKVPNPALQGLSGIDIPPGYQIPVGGEARALQDSVNISQRDAGMAGALMRTNMGIPPAQQGAAPIQQAGQEDPEIAKMAQLRDAGQVTNEEYEEFVRLRNASYGR